MEGPNIREHISIEEVSSPRGFRELDSEQEVVRLTVGEESRNTEKVERDLMTLTNPRKRAKAVVPVEDKLSKLDGTTNYELSTRGGSPNPSSEKTAMVTDVTERDKQSSDHTS